MQPYNCMRPSDPQIRESDLDVQAASDELASLLHADPADVVPVVNATAVLNTGSGLILEFGVPTCRPSPRIEKLRMQGACDEVARLLHADPADVVPVVNATSAVNTVLASTQLQPGDLIMTNSITYNAVRLCLGLELNRPLSKLEGRSSSAASGCPSCLELNPFAAYDGIHYKAEA